MKRFLLYSTALFIILFFSWFLVQMNPNMQFRRFKKELTRAYQQQIAALVDTTYSLRIQEPKLLQAKRQFYEYYIMNFRPNYNQLNRLNEQHRKEWLQLKKQMEDQLEEIQQLQKDPSLYNLGGAIKKTLVSNENQKWQIIERQLAEAPRYYKAAIDILAPSDAEKTRLAIEKQLLTLKLLQTELMDSLARAPLHEPQQQKIVQHNAQAQIAVKNYIAFCRSILFEYQDSTFVMKKVNNY
ncbi:MAG: hypothetical protein ACK4TA_10815 [Saprospiraceae bacterium]